MIVQAIQNMRANNTTAKAGQQLGVIKISATRLKRPQRISAQIVCLHGQAKFYWPEAQKFLQIAAL